MGEGDAAVFCLYSESFKPLDFPLLLFLHINQLYSSATFRKKYPACCSINSFTASHCNCFLFIWFNICFWGGGRLILSHSSSPVIVCLSLWLLMQQNQDKWTSLTHIFWNELFPATPSNKINMCMSQKNLNFPHNEHDGLSLTLHTDGGLSVECLQFVNSHTNNFLSERSFHPKALPAHC